jgi:GTP-binding protein
MADPFAEKTDAEKVRYANWLFKQECQFLRGADKLNDLPSFKLPEVGFIGRSNVGKSSLLNQLVNKKGLARTSNTPGRTQQLNFFDLNHQLILVDMPGYGYAKASKVLIENWNHLIQHYLQTRHNLKRIYLLIDSRHGLKPNDQEFMRWLDTLAISYQIILTKADKISLQKASIIFQQTQEQLKNFTAAYPFIIMTSAQDKRGIEQLRQEICQLIV